MSLQHHLASLGAVLLALAAGLVAGVAAGGPGDGTSAGEPVLAPRAPATAATAAPATEGEADQLLAESLAAIVAGSLGGRQVAVLALGAAADPVAETVVADLSSAGAVVSLRGTVDPSWTDPAGAVLRDGLTRQLGAEPLSAGDPLAVLLAGAATGSGAAGSSPATVWGVLAGAGLLSGTPPGDAVPEVVVVAAPATVEPATAPGWTALVGGLAATAPVVLVAPSPGHSGRAAGPGEASLVVAVRESPAGPLLSTVDHLDTGVGRLAVLRATADLPAGDRGHYGSLRGATSGAPARG